MIVTKNSYKADYLCSWYIISNIQFLKKNVIYVSEFSYDKGIIIMHVHV